MTRGEKAAVYNSRIAALGMKKPSPCKIRILKLLLAFVLSSVSTSLAVDWSTPEAQLAGKIAAVTGPGAASAEITNRSSLSRAEADEISGGLRAHLAGLGLRFVSSDAAAAVINISLSENLQDYVWVAEIRQGAGTSSVLMISFSRPGHAFSTQERATVSIHKALLWHQPEQILDVAIMDGSPTEMAVLDTSQVALYRLESGRWQIEASLPIAHARAWPRDPRGRLVLRKDHLFDAYLPGVLCRSTSQAPLGLNCSESDDPWPLNTDSRGGEQNNLNGFFTPSRNYFTGVLAPGVGRQSTVAPFYSAAWLPHDKYSLWVFAETDGHVHLLDGMSDQILANLDWGSDLASVHGACGANWSILATGNVDGTADSLRVFDLAAREPVALSQPEQFDGPITVLWTEANGQTAIAVSRSMGTGDYEAFRLSFLCDQ